MEEIQYIAQWLDTDGHWRESIGNDVSGGNQQAHYAVRAGMSPSDYLTKQAALIFADTLLGAYRPEAIRVIARIDRVIEI